VDRLGLLETVSSGSLTLATPSVRSKAANDSSTTARFSASVILPSSVWKTIGLASAVSDEKERAMTSLAAALSEPATSALLL
jgi:hypothetical protein